MNGYVYMFQHGSEEKFKIGKSKNAPETRSIGLQTGNPEALTLVRACYVSDIEAIEALMHQLLDPYHYRGEWFQGPRAYIERLFFDCCASDIGKVVIAPLIPTKPRTRLRKHFKAPNIIRQARIDQLLTHNPHLSAQKVYEQVGGDRARLFRYVREWKERHK